MEDDFKITAQELPGAIESILFISGDPVSVDKLAEINFVFEYNSYGSNVPVELLSPVIRLKVIGIMEIEVCDRSENFFLAEDLSSPIEADTLRRHSEYPGFRAFVHPLFMERVQPLFHIHMPHAHLGLDGKQVLHIMAQCIVMAQFVELLFCNPGTSV